MGEELVIRELETLDDVSLAFDLFNEIWAGDGSDAVPLNVMKAVAHARNYVAGVWQGERFAAASLAFAWGDLSARSLHSHITGVLGPWQGRGIGYALKLHQRDWAARRGYERITWTFDPLVQRNGWFNLAKLGARIEEYQPDFYGPMDDELNAGDPTDRCLAVWDVHPGDPRPGVNPGPPPLPLLVCGDDETPEVCGQPTPGAAAVSCQVPLDIVGIRRRDPGLALRWRRALRETMGAAIGAGFAASAMTRDGSYILESPGAREAR